MVRLFSFYNLGNTCYLNTTLQCLINQPHFKSSIKPCEKNEELIKIINEIDVNLEDNGENLNHKHNLTSLVKYFDSRFKLFQQHDAHEFLLELLDQLGITSFNGTINNCVTCNICKTVSKVSEEFTTIDLIVSKPNLLENFMDFLKREEIPDYYCEKCKKECLATKKSNLQKLNKFLVVVFKKYYFKERITYQNALKIRETESNQVFDYELYSIIYHTGNALNGHYNCNVKINGKWYFIDDAQIILTESLEMDNENAYILFYKKV